MTSFDFGLLTLTKSPCEPSWTDADERMQPVLTQATILTALISAIVRYICRKTPELLLWGWEQDWKAHTLENLEFSPPPLFLFLPSLSRSLSSTLFSPLSFSLSLSLSLSLFLSLTPPLSLYLPLFFPLSLSHQHKHIFSSPFSEFQHHPVRKD